MVVPTTKVRPEIRFDGNSLEGGLFAKPVQNRVFWDASHALARNWIHALVLELVQFWMVSLCRGNFHFTYIRIDVLIMYEKIVLDRIYVSRIL